jgi:predicted transcriptional regulator YdeE
MKRPFQYLVLALIFTCILILYKYLGGFNEPEITYESINEYIIGGKSYFGKVSDPAIESLFLEMKALKLEKNQKGPLVMVWFNEAKSKNDSVKIIIGLEMMPGEHIPDHLETIRIEMNGLVRAKIEGHASVLPSPSDVSHKIRAFADKYNYELQNLLIDKYLEESVVYTEIPVKTINN